MLKRFGITLLVVALAMPLFAGGKSCEVKSGQSVELNGTLTHDHDKNIFKVADTGKVYNVCEKTSADVLKLGSESGTQVHVKGQVVDCGGSQELRIDTANKI
jgi:hypothetical protein